MARSTELPPFNRQFYSGTEACLSDEPQTSSHEEVDENYGEFIEILTDPAPPSEKPEKRAAAGSPRWLIALLVLSVVMLVFAVVVFFLFI